MKKLFLIFLFSLITLFLVSSCTKYKTLPIPRAEKIEAISVLGADNVLIKVKAVGFGGGVGVGMGAPQITCESEEKFLQEIPKSSRIYTSVSKIDNYTVVRRYLSTSKNEGLVFIYELPVKYSPYPDRPRTVNKFNEDSVTFHWYGF